jgi:hypothetical protein
MSDKITPYKPIPYQAGNNPHTQYDVAVKDECGERIVTKVDYTTKKGKLVKGYTMFVKWV